MNTKQPWPAVSNTTGARERHTPAKGVPASSVRVDFLWDGSHVGAALFDEHLLASGPVAVFEVPGPAPSNGGVKQRFRATAESGAQFSIEVLRIERRNGECATIVGFLVPRPASASDAGQCRPIAT